MTNVKNRRRKHCQVIQYADGYNSVSLSIYREPDPEVPQFFSKAAVKQDGLYLSFNLNTTNQLEP